MTDSDIINIYESFINNIGTIIECHPVNDNMTNISKSRDIKYDPNSKVLHFYSSNSRQPLHNDYAYYPINKSPNYLALYCMEQSEYGGITSLISHMKVFEIMEKYNNDLYKKLIQKPTVNYKYTETKCDDMIHSKILADPKTFTINWNYFQIKSDINNNDTLELRSELFKFFEKYITDGMMCELYKNWKRGDCIIFNDQMVLHQRSSFFGSRHLKDTGFIYKI